MVQGWKTDRTGRSKELGRETEERWLSKSFSSPGTARIPRVVAKGTTIFAGERERGRQKERVEIKEGRSGCSKKRAAGPSYHGGWLVQNR